MLPLLHIQTGGPRWLQWSLHPDALLLCVVLGYAYYYCVTELRPKNSDAGNVRRSQAVLFYLGVAALYAAGGSPLHDIGERYLLSAHMLEHLIFAMVAAPLLVAGTPGWLWKVILCGPKVYPISRVLTKPIVAFSIFNALLVLMHLPHVMDGALQNGALHLFLHAVLVLSALLMWWPILSPLEELPMLSRPVQFGYLFGQSIVPAVIASFIVFSHRAVYPFYAHAPQLWHISPATDQIAGGAMMLLGSLILWSFVTVIFFRSHAREQVESKEPRWKDVEAELKEIGLVRQ